MGTLQRTHPFARFEPARFRDRAQGPVPKGPLGSPLIQESPLGCRQFGTIVAAREQVAVTVRRHLH